MKITPIVFITGGSRGIGKAIAEKYISEGWEVISPTRKEMDLSDVNSINQFFKDFHKPINVVINNAGINPIQDIANLNYNDILATTNVNYFAPLLILKNTHRFLLEAMDIRRVVNISSIWAYVSKPGRSIYAMSKTAMFGLTRTAAIEWASDNILVNSVAPGYTNTELTKLNNSPEDIKKIQENIPLRRMAEPSEIAETVFFLGSHKNSYITGQTILVDGGFTCV